MAISGRKLKLVHAAAIFLASLLGVSSFVLKVNQARTTTAISMSSSSASSKTKGKLLVLGGTGFLGQTICRRALLEGYQVTSLSRRGLPPDEPASKGIDFRSGDARKDGTIAEILQEGDYVGVVHCIGLLLDDASGLGTYNKFVSGSGSVPDENSSYDTITKLTAFNAIDATLGVATSEGSRFPFVFTSAAEAGWPDVPGGKQIEEFLAPEWLRRYLVAKRAVEEKLLSPSSSQLRPIIVRPSLIYSLDRPASYPPVGAFFVGNKLGLPFVDRPVTVQSLANAVVKSIAQESKVEGILRYPEIDSLNE